MSLFTEQELAEIAENEANGWKLKPCPFCGGEADVEGISQGWSGVRCTECDCGTRNDTADRWKVGVILWNRRVN